MSQCPRISNVLETDLALCRLDRLNSLPFPMLPCLDKTRAALESSTGGCDNGDILRVNKQADEATYRAYRFLTHGILLMLVVFFLAGERITWINCLTGLGWRTWLLLYALPSWFTAMRTPTAK
jgi:hypothetical protein